MNTCLLSRRTRFWMMMSAMVGNSELLLSLSGPNDNASVLWVAVKIRL